MYKLLQVALAIGSLAIASNIFGEPIEVRVCVWNVESGDADPAHISDWIEGRDDVDHWGLSEVTGDTDAKSFERASEVAFRSRTIPCAERDMAV